MDDRIDLVLAENALEQRLIAHVPPDDVHALERPAAYELRLRYPVADKARHVGALVKQPRHQPASDQACAACHERRAVAPERRHGQTLDGAGSARARSGIRSRDVSTGCRVKRIPNER